jgi:hypothetical protein
MLIYVFVAASRSGLLQRELVQELVIMLTVLYMRSPNHSSTEGKPVRIL